MNRRKFIRNGALAVGGLLVGRYAYDRIGEMASRDATGSDEYKKFTKDGEEGAEKVETLSTEPSADELEAKRREQELKDAQVLLAALAKKLAGYAKGDEEKKKVDAFVAGISALDSPKSIVEKINKVLPGYQPRFLGESDTISFTKADYLDFINVIPNELLLAAPDVNFQSKLSGITSSTDASSKGLVIGELSGSLTKRRYMLNEVSVELGELNGPEHNPVLTLLERAQLADRVFDYLVSKSQTSKVPSQKPENTGFGASFVRSAEEKSSRAVSPDDIRTAWKNMFSKYLRGERMENKEIDIVEFVLSRMFKESLMVLGQGKSESDVRAAMKGKVAKMFRRRNDYLSQDPDRMHTRPRFAEKREQDTN